MKKSRIFGIIIRIALFILVLSVSTLVALMLDETDGQRVYRFYDKLLGFELVGGLDLHDSHVKQLTMATDGQLYAVTNGGLFVTAGDSWRKIENLPEMAIIVAAAPTDPRVLYVGAPSSGLYRSTDGGQQWQNVSSGLGLLPGAALQVTKVAVDDQDANRIGVSTGYGLGSRLAPGGIYESFDGGTHWTRLGDSPALSSIWACGSVADKVLWGTERLVLLVRVQPEVIPEG